MLPSIGETRPWADPEVRAISRLAMHVPLAGFRRQRLDGVWSLELFDSPDEVPAGALTGIRPNAVQVAVPGNWTMQDLASAHGEVFVDKPHYTNVQMPFDGPPPRLPGRNPAGVYRRTVTVPADWHDDRIVLHVAGAESVHLVYVNGRFAGYGADSRLPSEYEVGRLLTQGVNDLAIVVVRYSAHSYIEDQDQWWMAGLHRSVWIESRPSVHIGDIRVATDFDPATGAGTVAATAAVDFGGDPAPGWSMRFELHDPAGRPSGPAVETSVPHQPDSEGNGFETGARWDLTQAGAWSAETPRLYTLAAELVGSDGSVTQSETQRVGLRRVEVRDRQLLVNGRPIRVFGVNRHDHHPDTGKAVTVEDMRDDLRLMRLHNINAVRTSHYPNDDAFYALCDELGFYVVDEANIEGHAHEDTICDDPSYQAAFLDCGIRMVQRDRNHPSVIVWSLGNETGYGVNHDALAERMRAEDPSRPLHYEPAVARAGLGARRRIRHRHRVSDVPGDRRHPQLRRVRRRPSTADHVRVQPRHGQQQRLAGRLLGRDRGDPRHPGWLPVGVEGPGPAPAPPGRCGAARLRGPVRRHTQRRQLRSRRADVRRPGTPPGPEGGRLGVPAGRSHRRRPRPADREPAGLHRPD